MSPISPEDEEYFYKNKHKKQDVNIFRKNDAPEITRVSHQNDDNRNAGLS